jgi:predicted ATPase/DNA-binding SARP family transcriptional activator
MGVGSGEAFWLAGLQGRGGWLTLRVYAGAGGAGGVGVRVLEFGVLGPVQAVRDGRELGLGGPKQRAVLALLLVEAGRAVPADYLVGALWRGAPPRGAAGTLRAYMSRLRGSLGSDVVLAARGGGYALEVEPDRLDAGRFERLVGAGRDALGRGEAAIAAGRFAEALALWRGRALADVAEVEPLALEAARLEELRLVAVEGRAEADLELGLAAEVAGELERLVAEYPLRERLWRLLVLALYRAERQADALAAYHRARQMLAGELGIEPGEELRRLEEAVLRQEVPPPAPRQVNHNLPAQLTGLLGREWELAALEELLGKARLITLTGAGGVGKTRLAVELAAGMLREFRDGVWLADLAGIADPELVPSLVMETLGVRQSSGVPVMEALGFRLRSAELLLVLDNCEHLLGACAELAVALLGGSPGLRVLATSREPLGVPGEAVYVVPPLAVPPEQADARAQPGAAAVRLFLERASAARAGGGAAAGPVAVVARICRELDGLPLAIELAAARASVLSVEEIEARLADKFGFLAYRRPIAGRRHQALKTAIGWSYDLLPAQEARVFGELSVFAGGFSLRAAAAVCCGGDEAAALDVTDGLAGKSLVVAEAAAGGTRYRLLDTIRQYAADRLAEAGEHGQARRRHAATFLDLAERERELAVLAREHDNFRAALDWSLSGDTEGSEIGPRLARALGGFWLARGFLQEGQGWLERALALGPADAETHADLLRLLGAVLHQAGDLEQAEAVLSEGFQVAATAGLRKVHARIQVLLADIHPRLGRCGIAEAAEESEAAAAVLESEGDLEGLAEAWLSIGQLRFFQGKGPASAEAIERAEACARRSANHYAQQEIARWLIVPYTELSISADAAIGHAEQLLEAAAGDPWAEASIVAQLAVLYAFVGRFADARAAIVRSQSTFTGAGAKFSWAECQMHAGWIEMMAGNPAAAERVLKQGSEALREMGDRAYLSSVLATLAHALYAQGLLGEAQQLTEEVEVISSADDISEQARWRLTRAKVLARRGQFTTARQLVGEAGALAAPTSWPAMHAEVLAAQAEVYQLAGAREEAADSLRKALRIYEERRASALAERTRAALASLTTRAGTGPA